MYVSKHRLESDGLEAHSTKGDILYFQATIK